QDTLARELRAAVAAGRPFWSASLLQRYERRHRVATHPLYLATQMLAGLYTDDRRPARVLRKLALGAGARLGPFKRMVMSGLTADSAGVPAPLRMLRARVQARHD
ncbi:MAG: FAD-dependent hydroxylase, partial [Rhodanobacter sp.]